MLEHARSQQWGVREGVAQKEAAQRAASVSEGLVSFAISPDTTFVIGPPPIAM